MSSEHVDLVELRVKWFRRGQRAALNKRNSCICIFTDPGDDLERECAYHGIERRSYEAEIRNLREALEGVTRRDPWRLTKVWSDGSWDLECQHCSAKGFLPHAGDSSKTHKEGCEYLKALDVLKAIEGDKGDDE